jgi:hypothetical protein
MISVELCLLISTCKCYLPIMQEILKNLIITNVWLSCNDFVPCNYLGLVTCDDLSIFPYAINQVKPGLGTNMLALHADHYIRHRDISL